MVKVNATSLEVFTPATDRLVIATVDGAELDQIEVSAQYNPKELGKQAQATWSPANGNGKKPSGGKQTLSWTGTAPQTMTAELLFDGVEENKSIQPAIDALISLTEPRRMQSSDAWQRRPPLCVAVWGVSPAFRCIVAGVQVKVTMFGKDGTPLRATCTVTLTEADVVAMWDAEDPYHQHHAGDVDSRENELKNLSRDIPLE